MNVYLACAFVLGAPFFFCIDVLRIFGLFLLSIAFLVLLMAGFVVCCLDLNYGHGLAGRAEKKVLEGFDGVVWVRIVYKMT
jgi:hypothetical protein